MKFDFKRKLTALRRIKNMSQAELAEAIGVSPDTERRWEWGKQEPRLGELLLLAQVLGVGIAELATGEKQEQSGAISIQRGDIRLDIPATPEGFAFVEGKLKEFTAGDSPRADSSTRKPAV